METLPTYDTMKQRLLLLPLAMLLLFHSGCERPAMSSVTIQFRRDNPAADEKALKTLILTQSSKAELLPIRNTELFQIRIVDVDPQKAADEANRIADALEAIVKTEYPEAKFVIWERAEP
jgi:hypothetical protein